jgi:hypothetical protein
MRCFLFIIISYLGIFTGIAQNNFESFLENEVELGYQVTERYAHSFGIENRNYLYNDEAFIFEVKQIGLSHFSEYELLENKTIGIGIKYRFEKLFDNSEENELRLMQLFEWENLQATYSIKNRFRTEQRFYTSKTKYRFRYELGIKRWMNTIKNNYLKAETESLFELAKTSKPELEQRFTIVYGWQLKTDFEIEIGSQYRIADYTQTLGHELFFVVGIEIDL